MGIERIVRLVRGTSEWVTWGLALLWVLFMWVIIAVKADSDGWDEFGRYLTNWSLLLNSIFCTIELVGRVTLIRHPKTKARDRIEREGMWFYVFFVVPLFQANIVVAMFVFWTTFILLYLNPAILLSMAVEYNPYEDMLLGAIMLGDWLVHVVMFIVLLLYLIVLWEKMAEIATVVEVLTGGSIAWLSVLVSVFTFVVPLALLTIYRISHDPVDVYMINLPMWLQILYVFLFLAVVTLFAIGAAIASLRYVNPRETDSRARRALPRVTYQIAAGVSTVVLFIVLVVVSIRGIFGVALWKRLATFTMLLEAVFCFLLLWKKLVRPVSRWFFWFLWSLAWTQFTLAFIVIGDSPTSNDVDTVAGLSGFDLVWARVMYVIPVLVMQWLLLSLPRRKLRATLFPAYGTDQTKDWNFHWRFFHLVLFAIVAVFLVVLVHWAIWPPVTVYGLNISNGWWFLTVAYGTVGFGVIFPTIISEQVMNEK